MDRSVRTHSCIKKNHTRWPLQQYRSRVRLKIYYLCLVMIVDPYFQEWWPPIEGKNSKKTLNLNTLTISSTVIIPLDNTEYDNYRLLQVCRLQTINTFHIRRMGREGGREGKEGREGGSERDSSVYIYRTCTQVGTWQDRNHVTTILHNKERSPTR